MPYANCASVHQTWIQQRSTILLTLYCPRSPILVISCGKIYIIFILFGIYSRQDWYKFREWREEFDAKTHQYVVQNKIQQTCQSITIYNKHTMCIFYYLWMLFKKIKIGVHSHDCIPGFSVLIIVLWSFGIINSCIKLVCEPYMYMVLKLWNSV